MKPFAREDATAARNFRRLRMYRVYWTLDPYGATIEKPDRKVLIDEVTPAPNEKS